MKLALHDNLLRCVYIIICMRDKYILLGSLCLLADVNFGKTKQELN